jgi:hypothetical protein
MAHVIRPVRGEVDTIKGRIVARVFGRRGQSYLHLGPTGQGFPSKLSALEFITRSVREGIKVASCLRSADEVPAQPAPKATIFVKTINKPKLRREAHASLDPRPLATHRRKTQRSENAIKARTHRSDGVTRCSKCPPTSCCPTCAQINNARQIAGLIRPKGSPEPHPNNCMPCIPHTPGYAGQRPLPNTRRPGGEIVSMDIKPLGGGWFLGAASLGLVTVYERKFRSRDKAREYAVNSMVAIKEGLRFEQLINA